MKRALLIGIDEYYHANDLAGCVNDAHALQPLIARHEDDSPNFDCVVKTTANDFVGRRELLEWTRNLLAPGADVALFYFAGHGSPSADDVTLVTQDGQNGDLGVTMSEILAQVQQSQVREVIIILDCCFAGGAGGVPQIGGGGSVIRPGLSILAASRQDQPAAETANGRGQFSTYLCGALDGGAADVIGKVTVAGIYAYLSESFGTWDQRPTFKANVDRLHDLRNCAPAVPLCDLRQLATLFPAGNFEFPLDPSYEPDAEPDDPAHEAIFAILQKCRAAKLVEPVGEEHMYFAAMNSKACRLTPLGRLYWWMARQRRI